MPDTPASTAKPAFGFLGQKVGPLPLWMWMAAGIGVWYYLQKRNAASASGTAVPNQQTDPAGNIGTIDPATGYVYGTPEDLAALAANNAGTGGGAGGGGGGGAGTGQTFANNEAWGSAAESYLVSTGINPTDASNAITTYLASQALTSAQQAMVNLAISILGPPPELPGPARTSSGSTVPPGTTPAAGTCPSGYTYSAAQTGKPGEIAASGGTGYCELTSESVPPPGITAPPPGKTPVPTAPSKPGAVSGFKTTSVGSTSVGLSWSPVSGATKYYLQVTYQTQTVASQTVTGTSATFSGLRADSTMNAHVTAQNAAGSGPTAQVGFHTSK